jgi:hypothetical protein
MQELEGSFININAAYSEIDYINPSIRDFIENVLREQTEYARDVVAAAIRFEQMAGLWSIAIDSPSLALGALLAFEERSVAKRLSFIFGSQGCGWEEWDGSLFSDLDMSASARIESLLTWAARVKSESILDIAESVFSRARSKRGEMSIGQVVSLLRRLDEGVWLSDSRVGKKLRLKLVRFISASLPSTDYEGWVALLNYLRKPAKPVGLESAKVDKAVKTYVGEEVVETIAGCSSVAQVEEVQRNLLRIQERGIDVDVALEAAQARVEELGSEPSEDDDDEEIEDRRENSSDRIDEEKIRDLFKTLLV